jgi:acetolactate synthase small subunit
MRHTLSVLVRNEFGVLSRVVGMFSGRGYNIDCLNVAPTLDPKVSHVTIVTDGDGQNDAQTFVFIDERTMKWNVLEGKTITFRRD